jgi:hypothetical protein
MRLLDDVHQLVPMVEGGGLDGPRVDRVEGIIYVVGMILQLETHAELVEDVIQHLAAADK